MINESQKLTEAIAVLQTKRDNDLMLLKHQWHITYEGFKPVNLIKKGLTEIVSSGDIKSNIISTAMGIGAGIAARKLMVGNSSNPSKKLLGTLLQFVVANIVTKHSDGIKSAGKALLNQFGEETNDTLLPSTNHEIDY